MLYGWAIDQGVQEKRSGSEIDHRRAGDPNRIDVATEKLANRYGGPEIALPNHRASGGVERINVVRFGHGNDHWTVRSALDVKRLGLNVAYNCAIKVQITQEVSGGRGREGRIDVNAVPGRIVVLLRDVDLRAYRKSCPPQACSDKYENANRRFHKPTRIKSRPFLPQCAARLSSSVPNRWCPNLKIGKRLRTLPPNQTQTCTS